MGFPLVVMEFVSVYVSDAGVTVMPPCIYSSLTVPMNVGE